MIAPENFVDEIDCGSFFDHIDDLLDFPADDIEACLSGPDSTAAKNGSGGNVNSFPSIWSAHSDSLACSDSVFSHNHSASDLSAELSVPYEDIVQLEWLSNFVEDSFSGGSLTMKKEESTSINKGLSNQFRTSSPVSVLESSSSCSGDQKVSPRSPEMVASGRRVRARSKRPRPATFTPRPPMQLISPSSSITDAQLQQPFFVPKAHSDSENCAESRLLIKLPKQVAPEHKKKKFKFTIPLGQKAEANRTSGSAAAGAATTTQTQAVRKCMHCEITKTPQWRAGPMGPKTLCNACGVRYKSGRLFPEYRPAASPTFVPSLHSNSHKKVVEMRTKVCENIIMRGATTGMRVDSPELIPNHYSLSMDCI